MKKCTITGGTGGKADFPGRGIYVRRSCGLCCLEFKRDAERVFEQYQAGRRLHNLSGLSGEGVQAIYRIYKP